MFTDLCDVAVLRSERCDAAEARDTIAAFLDRASSTTLPDLRQDIVNNVKKVHSALECFANGEPPPMSPTLSLPDSLDGWLPPSTRQSSGATVAESLDSWLQDKNGSHKGNNTGSKLGSPKSVVEAATPLGAQNVVQGNWNRLMETPLQPQETPGPALMIAEGATDEKPASPSGPDRQPAECGDDGVAKEANAAEEGDENVLQVEKTPKAKRQKQKKRKRGASTGDEEKETCSGESPAENKNNRGGEPTSKRSKPKKPRSKREKLSGNGQ